MCKPIVRKSNKKDAEGDLMTTEDPTEDNDQNDAAARLKWHSLFRGSEQAGELLASFELFPMVGERHKIL